jgi:predicted metal-binding membrane protein
MISERTSERAFFGASALAFAASTAATIAWRAFMPNMGETPMPGGWTMSMAWMQMCGQTWSDAAGSFLRMWVVMMAAMMLPSLAPMLWGYRRAAGRTGTTALAGVGYFIVWAAIGMALFPLGAALAAVEMKQPALARAAPFAAAIVVLIAGALQFTRWKAHRLACCRETPAPCHRSPTVGAALRHGLSLGLRCSLCCANLTAILLVVGMMDLRLMVALTVAITAERIAPAGSGVAQAIGIAAVGAGLFLIVRAAGLG